MDYSADFQLLDRLGSEQKRNLTPSELIEEALQRREGLLSDTGALLCRTGKFTGRSPKDRYFVKDEETADQINWSSVNQPISEEYFDHLFHKMTQSLGDQKLYVRDAYLGASETYRLAVRIYNTEAWHNLFCYNMFLRPSETEMKHFVPGFSIICAPTFEASPQEDGTQSKNFVIIHIKKGVILIGGTGYAGEMKKSMFTVMNYLLPVRHHVFPMHCSVNIGKEQRDTAVFFGLSGTGKTTLSADPNRLLIGDDEHGWTDQEVFNFEGGCYAKTIHLSEKSEPQIWRAIRFGAIVENNTFFSKTRTINYEDASITENTRTCYPISHISHAVEPSVATMPRHLFFLTADAFGVLPPITKLSEAQAMYHFISGYTAKVAGTETGITEPQMVFSACFGAPFLPLHPVKYAQMLGEKMRQHKVSVWLVNTGWTGGPYGIGKRMSLAYTRATIAAALSGALEKVSYQEDTIFGLQVPLSCPGVPSEILLPRNTWQDKHAYDEKALYLAHAFHKNFEKYVAVADASILKGEPCVSTN